MENLRTNSNERMVKRKLEECEVPDRKTKGWKGGRREDKNDEKIMHKD